jgi:hypothetical protein
MIQNSDAIWTYQSCTAPRSRSRLRPVSIARYSFCANVVDGDAYGRQFYSFCASVVYDDTYRRRARCWRRVVTYLLDIL